MVELLVVCAIVASLIGLTLAAVQRVRVRAAQVECAFRLRNLALTTHLYSATHRYLPMGCDHFGLAGQASPGDSSSFAGLSWHTAILPYVEQDALWRRAFQARLADPFGLSPDHQAVRRADVPVFRCPADGRTVGGYGGNGGDWALSGYRGVAGTHLRLNDGLLHPNIRVRLNEVTDGTSNTLLIGERPPAPFGAYGAWYGEWGSSICQLAQILAAGRADWLPREGIGCQRFPSAFLPGRLDDVCHVTHFWSLHPNGANFAFADGSVRFLTYSVAPVLPALATRADGEVVEVP